MHISLDGYNAAVIQFGFVVFFSVSFPIAPLFAALHNLIQKRIGILFYFIIKTLIIFFKDTKDHLPFKMITLDRGKPGFQYFQK